MQHIIIALVYLANLHVVSAGEGVQIDPIVIYMLILVCSFAFLPPCIFKCIQVFHLCEAKVAPEDGEEET